jgi:hypothetical protein
VKLPLTISQERLNECIDMDRLHALQGIHFESVQARMTSLDETFAKMIHHTEKEEAPETGRSRLISDGGGALEVSVAAS